MSIKQAIEALQCMVDEKADYMIRNKLGNPFVEHSTKQAIAALTALRSMPQGDPVAWLITDGEECFATNEHGRHLDYPESARTPLIATPHTAPPLSDAEIAEACKGVLCVHPNAQTTRDIARAIERAVREAKP